MPPRSVRGGFTRRRDEFEIREQAYPLRQLLGIAMRRGRRRSEQHRDRLRPETLLRLLAEHMMGDGVAVDAGEALAPRLVLQQRSHPIQQMVMLMLGEN